MVQAQHAQNVLNNSKSHLFKSLFNTNKWGKNHYWLQFQCGVQRGKYQVKTKQTKFGSNQKPYKLCYDVHLAKLIPRRFLKPAMCKYPTTMNNSEIYILLPKPCPWMWHLLCGNRERNGSDRKPETGKTRLLKLALFLKNPIGAAM